jgi:hypothetical protein
MLEDVLANARLIVEDAQEKLPVESAAAIEQVYNDINNLNNFILKEVKVIENDRNLKKGAKSVAKRKVLEQAGRKLEVLKARRTLAALIEELEATISASTEGGDVSLLKYLREKEVRDRLSGMTDTQILALFGESLLAGSNPLLLDAILNAPEGFEMLPADTLSELRMVRAKLMNPEAAAELETARTLNSSIEKMLSQVKKALDYLRKKELPVSLSP